LYLQLVSGCPCLFLMSLTGHFQCTLSTILGSVTQSLCVHFLSSLHFLNTLLYIIVTTGYKDTPSCTFKMLSLNFLKRLPWSGFLRRSATMSPVGQEIISISLFSTLSVMKKYLVSMCQVHLLLDALPFLPNSIVLMLSW